MLLGWHVGSHTNNSVASEPREGSPALEVISDAELQLITSYSVANFSRNSVCLGRRSFSGFPNPGVYNQVDSTQGLQKARNVPIALLARGGGGGGGGSTASPSRSKSYTADASLGRITCAGNLSS